MPNTSTAGPSSTMSWRCLWTASSSSSTNNTELEHRPYKPLSINQFDRDFNIYNNNVRCGLADMKRPILCML